MTKTATESYVDSEIAKHANRGSEKRNELKDELSSIIQQDRHDSKNRDQNIIMDIHENRENIALHTQSQKFMQEKVENIERHLSEGITEIKAIIEKQAETFATKTEHAENKEKINTVIKVIWGIGAILVTGMGTFIWSLITEIIKNG